MWIFPRPVDDQLAVRPQLGDAVQPLHIGKEPRQIGTAIIMEADQRAAWPYVDLRNACLHAVHLDFDQPQQILRSGRQFRSEEHTSELQSLMRISYAVFCLKTKKTSEDTISQL